MKITLNDVWTLRYGAHLEDLRTNSRNGGGGVLVLHPNHFLTKREIIEFLRRYDYNKEKVYELFLAAKDEFIIQEASYQAINTPNDSNIQILHPHWTYELRLRSETNNILNYSVIAAP